MARLVRIIYSTYYTKVVIFHSKVTKHCACAVKWAFLRRWPLHSGQTLSPAQRLVLGKDSAAEGVWRAFKKRTNGPMASDRLMTRECNLLPSFDFVYIPTVLMESNTPCFVYKSISWCWNLQLCRFFLSFPSLVLSRPTWRHVLETPHAPLLPRALNYPFIYQPVRNQIVQNGLVSSIWRGTTHPSNKVTEAK